MKLTPKSKKGGVVSNTVMGIGGLIIAVVITLVIVSTILGANLLSDTNKSAVAGNKAINFNISAQGMQGNFTTGLQDVSEKLPTILLIVAVVFLFGALVLLVKQSRAMGIGGGGGSSL